MGEGRTEPPGADRRGGRRLTVPEAATVLGVVLADESPHVEAMKARAERLGDEADPERVEELRAGLTEGWGEMVAKDGLIGD